MTRSVALADTMMLAAWLAFPSLAQDTVATRRASRMISPEEVRRHIYVIADDSMRGRSTPSPGLEATAQYIANEFRRAGLRPGGDNDTYFQRYKVDQVQFLPESTAVWTTGTQSIRWTYGVDYVPHLFNDFADWDISGSAVLLVGPVGGRIAFDTTSLLGRVLIIPLTAAGLGQNFGRIVSWRPAAVLRVQDVSDFALSQMATEVARPKVRIPGSGLARLPMIVVTDRAAQPLFLKASINLAELRRSPRDTVLRMIPLGDAVVHLKLRVKPLFHQDPANVIAIRDGIDPELRGQYIVYSAHMDHLGVGTSVSGDSIYNGADDNASGAAAVLATAKAFAHLTTPLRRSVMFVLFSGEEGLAAGSGFFLNHAPVPLPAIVADLNADMVGRNGRDSVIVVGRRDSDLGKVLDHAIAAFPDARLTVTDGATGPDDSYLYWWSDHAGFVKKGIPFLYFYTGLHSDYHRPSDSADKIDVDKLACIGRLMFYIGIELSNATTRPQWYADRFEQLVAEH